MKSSGIKKGHLQFFLEVEDLSGFTTQIPYSHLEPLVKIEATKYFIQVIERVFKRSFEMLEILPKVEKTVKEVSAAFNSFRD